MYLQCATVSALAVAEEFMRCVGPGVDMAFFLGLHFRTHELVVE